MYNSFSKDYDRFVNWPGRLAFELPFLENQLQGVFAKTVLDAATGTGMHVVALAQRGYQIAGADISEGMIDVARQNAAREGIEAEFNVAGFGQLTAAFGIGSLRAGFDELFCLGNSLPHLQTNTELAGALADFAACLRPGGLLLIQNRNYDSVLAGQERWMEPQSYREGEQEWIFVRFYDFRPDGMINFNILTLHRQAGSWQQQLNNTLLYPQRQFELVNAIKEAGFTRIQSYGGLDGSPFDQSQSGNLILTAIRNIN